MNHVSWYILFHEVIINDTCITFLGRDWSDTIHNTCIMFLGRHRSRNFKFQDLPLGIQPLYFEHLVHCGASVAWLNSFYWFWI